MGAVEVGHSGRVEPDEIRAVWDAEAATFDQEADHGLTDPATREAWWQLLSVAFPPQHEVVPDPARLERAATFRGGSTLRWLSRNHKHRSRTA